MVAKPQKSLPAAWQALRGLRWPRGRLREGLPSTGGAAPPWPGGCSARRCCPSAGWEIPSCPSSIPPPSPLPAAHGPLLGACQHHASVPFSIAPLAPWAPASPSGHARMLQNPSRGAPGSHLPTPGALPEPSSLGSDGRERREEGFSFSTFSSQEGAGSPMPRALSGSPPCSLAPSGCSERQAECRNTTPPHNPPHPRSPPLLTERGQRGPRCGFIHAGGGMGTRWHREGALVAPSALSHGGAGKG